MRLSWKRMSASCYQARGGDDRRYELIRTTGPLGPMWSVTVYERGTKSTERHISTVGGGTPKTVLDRAKAAAQTYENVATPTEVTELAAYGL